jgi:hypothetical protein
MKNKDTMLLEEAYQRILEANFIQNAASAGRYTVNSLIDKGKNALGIKVSPRNYGESWEDWATRLGIEPPPLEDKAALDAWNKKYPAAAAILAAERKKNADEEAYRKSPEGRQKEIDDYQQGMTKLDREREDRAKLRRNLGLD